MKPKIEEDAFLTKSDFVHLYRRHRKAIGKSAWGLSALVFCFLIFQEPHFTTRATFQHSMKQNEISSSMKEMFQQYISLPAENGTQTILQSNSMLKNTVADLGLQVRVRTANWLLCLVKNVYDNFVAQLGCRLSDVEAFQFRKVRYYGEKKELYYIEPLSSDAYRLWNGNKESVGLGRVGVPFYSAGFEMIVSRMPKNAVYGSCYRMTLLPWQAAVKKVRSRLRLQKAKLDKGILVLSFSARDRQVASDLLNHLMENYQQYLKRENEEICQAQLAYLENRQEELTKRLDVALTEHVAYLKENLTKDGHIGLIQEIDSLSAPRNEYLGKLFEIDLQMKRMGGYPDTALPKKRMRSIEKAPPVKASSAPIHYTVENHLRQQLRENALEMGRLQSISVVGDPDLSVQEDLFIGLNLESSKNLWAQYTAQRDQLQAQLRELAFLRDQIRDPSFELSSAGVFFSDAVMNDLLQKTSAVSLQLKDEQNRSPRDQERLQETLKTQKKFVSEHLDQTVELTQLRCDLLEDKIDLLRKATLALLASEKALLSEKLGEIGLKMLELPDKWRRESLLVLKKELGVRMIEGMTQLAEAKNISQNLYQANSKPIDPATPPLYPNTPLALILSLAAFLVGGGSAYFLFLCRMLSRGVPVSLEQLRAMGFPVAGALSRYCRTPLAQLQESDLETLRNVCDRITFAKQFPQCSVVIGGSYLDYSRSLAELLALRGLKVVLVDAVWDAVVRPADQPGLSHYLSGLEEEVVLRSEFSYDFLPSGGTSRFGVEKLNSPRFAQLLAQLKQKYDVVLVYSSAFPGKVEGKALLAFADTAVVSADRETKEELRPYCEWNRAHEGAAAVFVYLGCYE